MRDTIQENHFIFIFFSLKKNKNKELSFITGNSKPKAHSEFFVLIIFA